MVLTILIAIIMFAKMHCRCRGCYYCIIVHFVRDHSKYARFHFTLYEDLPTFFLFKLVLSATASLTLRHSKLFFTMIE